MVSDRSGGLLMHLVLNSAARPATIGGMATDRAYVSVLAFPDDMSERERIVALSEALGTDEYTAEMSQKWTTPAVVRVCPAVQALRIAKTLEDLGVPTYVALQEHLDKLSRPIVAKRLKGAIGAPTAMYAYEPLRPRMNDAGGFVMSDVFAFVAGRVIEKHSVTPTPQPTGEYGYAGEVTGAERTVSGSGGGAGRIASRLRDRFVLDLYLRDSRCVRIDTAHFSFDVLEGKLGFTDRENFRRLCDRFRAEAPRAHFDEEFGSFRPPAHVLTGGTRAMGDAIVHSHDTGPVFDFYSPWKYLLLARAWKKP